MSNTNDFLKITEQDSIYQNLEKMNTSELLTNINNEDKKVAHAVEACIPSIIPLVELIVNQMKQAGRLFYIGSGTSGRLGIVDASECPPTFGVPHNKVIGLIAGGDEAIRKAVENAEDNPKQGWIDLQKHKVSTKDVIIGIAASGTTPYVVEALKEANKNQIATACITMNPDSPLFRVAKHPIAAVVGPEFVTGSSRMKAGTAQKMILNMISTSVMIQLGHVKGNKMVDMQLSNKKLVDRGARMIVAATNIEYKEAVSVLMENGSVRKAIEHIENRND